MKTENIVNKKDKDGSLFTRVTGYIAKPVVVSPLFFFFIVFCVIATPLSDFGPSKSLCLRFVLSAGLQGVTIAYILCCVALLIPAGIWRRLMMALTGLPFALWMLIETGSIATTGAVVSTDSATVMFETNTSEAAGFFSQFLTWHAIGRIVSCVIAVIVLNLVFALLMKKTANKSWCRILTAVTVLICLIFGIREFYRLSGFLYTENQQEFLSWSGTGNENPELINMNYVQNGSLPLAGTYFIKYFSFESRQMKEWTALQTKLVEHRQVFPANSADNNFDIVIIIGESFIRSQSSLYGYYLNTNPRLGAEADSGLLYVFTDVTSPSNFTTTSLINVLNLNDLSSGENWWQYPYLPLLMKQAGWNVYHYDNQTIGKNTDVGISRVFYADVIDRNVLDAKSDRLFKYDGPYVDYVDKRLAKDEKPGKQFVIYHLMGQHFDCKDRYEGKAHFQPSDIKTSKPWIGQAEKQKIADYNNATLYNDSIVGRIIDRFRDKNAVVIYFSDHGEDNSELAPVKARNIQQPENAEWLERQFDIPFMVWMSPSFMKAYPQKAAAIRNAVNCKWSIDNLGQMVIGLTETKTRYYQPKRDILNPAFTPYRRVTAGGYTLDK